MVVDPYIYCGHCYPCRIGRTNCCTDLKVLGGHAILLDLVQEALDLIYTKKVDLNKILTKVVSIEEAPETIVDIEKNPGNYMKVVVRIADGPNPER